MPEIEASKFATQRDPLDAQVSGFLKASQAQPVDFFAHTIIVPNSALVTGGKYCCRCLQVVALHRF